MNSLISLCEEMQMVRFFDVTLPIDERMITYPSNPSPSIQRYSSIPRNAVNESLITIGSHAGTHVDSMLHIKNNAEGVDALSTNSFYGKCKVLDLTFVNKEIHQKDLEDFKIGKGDIILLKTRNSELGFGKFRSDYVHVKLDAAEYLVKAGVKTLGFDYLSVKKFREDREVHQILISNLTLFEGLNLADVPSGEYTFIGLPLRIKCDGSPARVILVEE